MEKRILFRLLSGLHSSIMTQIANDYRFDGECDPSARRERESVHLVGPWSSRVAEAAKLWFLSSCFQAVCFVSGKCFVS